VDGKQYHPPIKFKPRKSGIIFSYTKCRDVFEFLYCPGKKLYKEIASKIFPGDRRLWSPLPPFDKLRTG
jgi:hypothetical protein